MRVTGRLSQWRNTFDFMENLPARPCRLRGRPLKWVARKFVGVSHAAFGSGLFWGSSSCSWWLMRSMRSCRSLAVNFQLNGPAVRLQRSTKPSRAAESWSRLSKSFGVTTFFWITEKKIDLVQPGRVHRGVDHDRVRVRLGQPADRGLAAVV